MKKQISLFFLFFALSSFESKAQTAITLSTAEKKALVDSIGKQLRKKYIFGDVAEKMAVFISSELNAGKYDNLTDGAMICNRLTEDLQSISHDKHIRLWFDPKWIAAEKERSMLPDSAKGITAMDLKWSKNQNFGFKEMKILEGNIGYLDLTGFFDTRYGGGETAVAAMNFFANTEALIIDLRKNGGGSPGMIQLLISYLYDRDELIHLNDFYRRVGNETEQRWSLPYVPGKKLNQTEIYILTSTKTFSAAEEFTYNLKNLKRATIVGETTGGGANPGNWQILSDKVVMFLPDGQAINPITHTNWEGTGVEPDVKTTAEDALVQARILALEKLNKKYKDDPIYNWEITALQSQKKTIKADPELLKSCVGTYGDKIILNENGKLYFKPNASRPKEEMKLMEPSLFSIDAEWDTRIKIIAENGKVTGLMLLHPAGDSAVIKKNK